MNKSPESGFSVGWLFKPDAWAQATSLSGAVDCIGFRNLTVMQYAGTLGGSATLDMKLTESATSGGSYADVSGAAFTQVLAAADDVQEQMRVRLAPRLRYIKASLTIATAASDYGAAYVLSEPNDTTGRATQTWIKV